MGRLSVVFFLNIIGMVCCLAQSAPDPYTVKAAPLRDNWFVQAGVDLSLQNPYGHNIGQMLSKGRSFGVDAAVGKWFTPGLGLRAKVNWENGIALLGKNKAEWLAPFYQPGVNMDRGGYITTTGDILFDIQNLFLGYSADRRWHLYMFPTAGLAYNFGVSKGTPLLGVGIGSSYRVGPRVLMILDASYNMVSSGFVGVEKSTGTGSNSNGFFNIFLGVQINLGNNGFTRP